MKSRLRRKATENGEEENASSCGSPVKDKENFSPKSCKSRQSIDSQRDQFITLLKDFDQNVAMTKKEIYTNALVMADNTSLPFLQALTKLPSSIKNMKWGDYLKLRATRQQEGSLLPAVTKSISALVQDSAKLAVPTGSLSKLETPAIRSSSRLAKKLPAITPKFDLTTPAAHKRLPKPGEVLLSLKGSPVAVPNPTQLMARSISSLATTDEKDVLVALLSDPETLNNALKDKNTCKAIVEAYNNVKMLQD